GHTVLGRHRAGFAALAASAKIHTATRLFAVRIDDCRAVGAALRGLGCALPRLARVAVGAIAVARATGATSRAPVACVAVTGAWDLALARAGTVAAADDLGTCAALRVAFTHWVRARRFVRAVAAPCAGARSRACRMAAMRRARHCH